MKIVITGSRGFIGRNLRQHLLERGDVDVATYDRDQGPAELARAVDGAAFVFHLAGVNRPRDPREFTTGNLGSTEALCAALQRRRGSGDARPCVVYASSIRAGAESPYGQSKQAAERRLLDLQAQGTATVRILRLPNVFGKWARPNYNSVVATFCHNVARDLPIEVHDPAAELTLLHVDDLVATLLALLERGPGADTYVEAGPRYRTTVGELAELVYTFRNGRDSLTTERVGDGFLRALYSTFVSYLPTERFGYEVPQHRDPRGVFVEMLKTPDSGQFSYFTARPGVTRGGHYHHCKTEKFLVVRGEARFRFRHVQSGERHEIRVSGDRPVIVETVPGWTHDITNVGSDELIVLLWANEVFDRSRPDTCACPV
jgi:UDP-2-acetamido-2,6-beta-L-arabino-hexul-4-ose reductase